jgi:hypothetical protein
MTRLLAQILRNTATACAITVYLAAIALNPTESDTPPVHDYTYQQP